MSKSFITKLCAACFGLRAFVALPSQLGSQFVSSSNTKQASVKRRKTFPLASAILIPGKNLNTSFLMHELYLTDSFL